MNKAIHDRRWSARMLVCLAIVSAITLIPGTSFAATDSATLTVGRVSFGPSFSISGYSGGLGLGFYSPSGLAGGERVFGLFEIAIGASPNRNGVLNVIGFASDPGSTWLTSVSCNGITQAASAATYQFDGSATWSFPAGFGFTSLPGGTNLSCTIVHH